MEEDPIVRRAYGRDDAPPARRGDVFDRVIGRIDGLTDVRKSKPSTVTSVVPMLGDAQTYVIQTYKTPEGFFAFVQMVDAEGRARIVLPPRVAATLYRQREALIKSSRRERGRDRWSTMSADERDAAVTRLRSAKKPA